VKEEDYKNQSSRLSREGNKRKVQDIKKKLNEAHQSNEDK
jgi:hypothetical protein